ncbi:16S rRNA (cytidine(1402)-2'-O)-methyltransferase [Aeromicrobium phragmitis]|uniref:Ribosomal RNA small subunit methyltransferase I n=1 Tax=Aeromicrobium phragmitis TaxID=2478914 RepID=A0A3L8PMV5_9ACTN|nr:16S rRNA (cytidine(1402)-2'-O)-methyltransferase [Aeromicrobium phragmitis]RLV56727.1 16S rRNA (cytidine(1402)-2'-O)-methyltransferase [Aeromicrobium phragmitis]
MLILAGTPIGQAADASGRLGPALSAADIVAAEDTRRLRRLAADLGVEVPGRVVSYFEGNEERRTGELMEELRAGRTVVLVTDAGMPSVSDPGYRLVAAAVEEDIAVSAIPGPSAVLTALAVSGLPVDRFSFEGFPPRKQGERARFFAELARDRRTMVFFESPHRTAVTLRAMSEAFGADRPAALCRELTKTYEEVVRLPLAELAAWTEEQEHGVRGEVTLVISGAGDAPVAEYDDESLAALVAEAEATGLSRKDAIAEVVARTGVRKKIVYAAAHRPD